MTVTLDIPDQILAKLPATPRERDARLLLELAVALYAKGTLSIAQGSELAGLSRMDFGVELGERGVPRHYGEAELAEDLAFARGGGGALAGEAGRSPAESLRLEPRPVRECEGRAA